jgi:hypothetical protein
MTKLYVGQVNTNKVWQARKMIPLYSSPQIPWSYVIEFRNFYIFFLNLLEQKESDEIIFSRYFSVTKYE